MDKKEIIKELQELLEVLDMEAGEFIKARNLYRYTDVYPAKVGYARGILEYIIENSEI